MANYITYLTANGCSYLIHLSRYVIYVTVGGC